ncbi:hypothetical protein Pla108_01630 [Botrimarina colliarenosi]|uniref:Uncharacterized protein n=1 Tax=Botrimarina colliarenosi TaxID=2528001 RepID=A0A5C6AJ06_9BACT|nr:acyclic terpene utilization AtuA family protein [Botrimarina colliarenosi]TWT99228.1 hypothetical protein Pla108_01630 [Botrimarina colliarenosi]
MSSPVADAATLAAAAPPGGVLDPTDDLISSAYLDLRTDRPAVARSKLATVARAFGPRLRIQGGLRLLIATGDLAPAEAASRFARAAFPEDAAGGPMIAAIRGENVLDQLEAFIAAGCQLEEGAGKKSLTEENRPIVAALAPATWAAIQSAFAAGATVVVSRFAPPETLQSDRPEASDVVAVTLSLVEQYELSASLRERRKVDGLPISLRKSVTVREGRGADAGYLMASATQYDHLVEIAERVELATGPGAFEVPLKSLIQPKITKGQVVAPAALFEFGHDAQPAIDWVKG